MDSLAYAKAHNDEWVRLEKLAKQRRLSGIESDELIQLYQRVAGELAVIRTKAPDPDVVLRMSVALSRARSRITAEPISPWVAVVRFFTVILPFSFYRIRRWIWAVTAASMAVGAVVLALYSFSPNLIDTLGSYSTQQAYAKQAFEAYYTENAHSDFSMMVWSNNAWIALQCVAGGFTGVYPIVVLAHNMVGLGQTGAIMARFGDLGIFFQLITPHGLLELTAIFAAGAAGLRIFWALVHPEAFPRVASLGREGRHTVMVALGLVFVLFISGLIEGFITPSALPWWAKIAIGTVALAGFWAWVMILGKRAARLDGSETDDSSVGWHIEYAQ
ncbi:MAG: stage II sporulation protein M [Actinomycetaceae bacterium]|nr:stage II sporulation protein M [Arcanobacterium sp.]MDD7687680.1 stage II sporulation protein M [Actinomycetaceae bacterium]MDY5273929.1 stage II sporulation protein M [Arcanobacterium sp.]